MEEIKNKIICGDALEVLKTFENESIDCCITSPPYNKTGFRGKRDNSKGKGRWQGSDISYGDFKDDMDEIEYQNNQIEVLNELFRIIKKTGSIFYNHKVRRNNHKASHPIEWILKSKLNFYQQIIWDRAGTPDHNIGYFDPTTELIFWLTKDKPKMNKKINKYSTEVWRMTPDMNNDHPAPFPECFSENCIINVTDENDIILDPYMGSGTVAVSALNLKRNYIGIELNPEYIKIAEKRIKSISNKLL